MSAADGVSPAAPETYPGYAAYATGNAEAAGTSAGPGWLVRLAPRRMSRRVRTSVDRLAVASVCSLGAAWIHEHHDPGALCPLRRLTGVPCPLCGSTTVFMEAGAGHWTAALTANPLTVLAFFAFLASPLALIDPVGSWARLPARRRNLALGVLLALSWVWQLHRFGFVLGGTSFS
jgi:Protein of unknown function (DUF2752)